MLLDRSTCDAVGCRHEDHRASPRAEVSTVRPYLGATGQSRPAAVPEVLGAGGGMRHALAQPTRWERRVLRVLGRALGVLGFGLIFCLLALLLGA